MSDRALLDWLFANCRIVCFADGGRIVHDPRPAVAVDARLFMEQAAEASVHRLGAACGPAPTGPGPSSDPANTGRNERENALAGRQGKG